MRRVNQWTSWLVIVGTMTLALTPIFAAAQQTPDAADQTKVDTKVRVLHASPRVQEKIRVAINNREQIVDLDYGQMSDFVDVRPGEVWVQIEESTINLFGTLFSAVYPYVPAGNHYQLIMTDNLVIGGIVDVTPVSEGMARARFVNASGSTPAVDVVVKDTDTAVATAIPYPFSSDYGDVAPGSYDLVVRQSDTGTVLLEVPGVTMEAGKVYDLIAFGNIGDSNRPLAVVVAVADATT